MAYAASYTIADSATVNQNWNRVSLEKGYARYVNDTARAAGVEEWFELRAQDAIAKKTTPTTLTLKGKWNLKLYTKSSTDAEPTISNFTFDTTQAVSNVVATARARMKNHRLVYIALSDTDAEVDDVTAFRAL